MPEPEPEPEPAPAPRPRRPPVMMSSKSKISSTFGTTPGSKLTLKGSPGDVTLHVPEGSLDRDYNLEWSLVTRNPPKKGSPAGPVARLSVQPGGKTSLKAAQTDGDDFEIILPLDGKETVNLAVGTATVDARGTEGKVTWSILAPVKVEKGLDKAYFGFKAIGPVQYFHATADAATEESTPAAP